MRTIPALIEAATRLHADRTWLITDDEQLTFSAAAARIGGIAHALRDHGVHHDDVVLVTARNEPRYLLTLLALTTLGAVAVPVNPKSSPAELRGLLGQLGSVRVITDDHAAPTLHDADPDARVLNVGDLADAAPAPVGSLPRAPEETQVAFMIPTSGTTGRSKLVMQTHRTHVLSGEGFPYWMQLGSDDRLMTSLPLFHTNALAYSTMGSLACGAGLVLLPRFSASGFLDTARRHRATTFNSVGGILEYLLRQPVRRDDADTPLRVAYTAPAPPRDLHVAIERRFGLTLVCGYGMSESPYGLIWQPGTHPYGALGSPRQHPHLGDINQARVVDDDGRDVGEGTTGELLLRNPTVTPGYYGLPDETAQALAGGWLHTGDLVTPNGDGTYTFVARRKEVIRRRGENLAPAEVEQALLAHPAVVDCAVVGVPAGLAEEEVKAYVQPVDRAAVTAADLHAWTTEQLAAFKVPRYWQFVAELPRTPTGRIAKHQLDAITEADEYDLAPTPGAST